MRIGRSSEIRPDPRTAQPRRTQQGLHPPPKRILEEVQAGIKALNAATKSLEPKHECIGCMALPHGQVLCQKGLQGDGRQLGIPHTAAGGAEPRTHQTLAGAVFVRVQSRHDAQTARTAWLNTTGSAWRRPRPIRGQTAIGVSAAN